MRNWMELARRVLIFAVTFWLTALLLRQQLVSVGQITLVVVFTCCYGIPGLLRFYLAGNLKSVRELRAQTAAQMQAETLYRSRVEGIIDQYDRIIGHGRTCSCTALVGSNRRN